MTSLQPSDGPKITLASKAAKYHEHLRDDTGRPGVKRTIRYLRDHAIDYATAERFSLGFVNPAEPADRQFEGRLAIPYLTRDGIKAFKYRCVEDHDCKEFNKTVPYEHAKYAAPLNQEPIIYNPEAFFDAEDVIGVAEGEIDAIVATVFLGIPTIGIPGVEIWQQNRKIWRRTLEDYDNVLIFVDGDEPTPAHPSGAGLEFARAVAKDVGPKARLVRCPSGEDVASMVASGQRDILMERAGLNA